MFANNRDVILIPVCILIIIIGSIPVTALDAPIDTELVYSSYVGGSEDDTGSALAPDGSGGIWVAGWINQSTQSGGHLDAFVSHFSSTGMLLSSTYLGGSEYDIGNALAPDGSGGVWVAGSTHSADFPVTDDAYQRNLKESGDAFVSHFSSTGVLLFSTYLGGSYSEEGWDLAIDGSGGVWVAGETCSNDFPVTDDAYQNSKAGGTGDAFVTHFSSTGTLLSSTYLGGSNWDKGHAIAPDDSGGVWIGGWTESTNFPVLNPYQGTYGYGSGDAFVTHFSSSGSLLSSTYLGGAGYDMGNALAPDGSGGVWAAGYWDAGAFVFHFSSTGSVLSDTFLNGSGIDAGWALAPDGSGGAWAAGETESTDFPVTDDAYQSSKAGGGRDAFVSHFSSTGVLLSSTYFGSNGDDAGYALAPDDSGGSWVAGYTYSTDFPVTDDAYQSSCGGGVDAFIARFSESPSGLKSPAKITAAIPIELLNNIDTAIDANPDSKYYNENWGISKDQYKLMIATLAWAEGGSAGYTAHSSKTDVDKFSKIKPDGTPYFSFCTGIGPFQIDNWIVSSQEYPDVTKWHMWTTLEKLDSSKALEETLRRHKIRAGTTPINNLEALRAEFKGAWYGYQLSVTGNWPDKWLSVTGTPWDEITSSSSISDQNNGIIIKDYDTSWNQIKDALGNNAKDFKKYEDLVKVKPAYWDIRKSDKIFTDRGNQVIVKGQYETYKIDVLKSQVGDTESLRFSYFYAVIPEQNIEIWAFNDPINPNGPYHLKSIFIRDYTKPDKESSNGKYWPIAQFPEGVTRDDSGNLVINKYGDELSHNVLDISQFTVSVKSITPNTAVNTKTFQVRDLEGTGFVPGAKVCLRRSGYSDIEADQVNVISSNKIMCTFNLNGAPGGYWNVVVTNPDGETGSLINGFTVKAKKI